MSKRQMVGLLFAGTLLTGCAGQERPDANPATLTLLVELDGGVEVNRLHYRLAGNGLLPAVGSVAVAAEDGVATVVLPAPAPGPGYRVDLSAESADGEDLCRGGFAVNVAAAEPASARLVLLCRPTVVGIPYEEAGPSCPALDSYGASSFFAPVGTRIQLYASASDEDPEDRLRYRWTSDRGQVINGNRPQAGFLCERAGRFTVTAAVDDGWCTSGVFFTVTCQGDAGGPLAGR
jgi:hypothetical protein